MNEQSTQSTGVSRKAFGAGMAISAMAGIDCDEPLVKIGAIVVVAMTAIIIQGIIDWKKDHGSKT